MGTEGNEHERLCLEVDSKCQGVHHQKAPVGTVGFQLDKAGQRGNQGGSNEPVVCTVCFCFLERKFLEAVEAGTVKINQTKRGVNAVQFNCKLWDCNTWVPRSMPDCD
jgi:hypothetical protein